MQPCRHSDCFKCTVWREFKKKKKEKAATFNQYVKEEDYAGSETCCITKCVKDVTVRKYVSLKKKKKSVLETFRFKNAAF